MADNDARDYVLAFEHDKPAATQIAKNTAQKLQNGSTKLLEVVRALSEYITSEEESIRTKAVNYLTAIVLALPPTFLNRQQIQVLNAFLSSRIEDAGAIEGLSALQSSSRYTKEMAQDLAQAVFDHFVDLQSKPQSFRYKVYNLFNELLSNHRKAIREMSDKSLTGIVRVVAGEKDPRNLMLIFSILRVFMIEWDITNHVDMLFDSVYAYFPITFRPPPNDPYGITAQDLKDRLRDCISSTGALAPSAFPNLLDKLDATSEAVKKDVLQALAACALNYSPTVMAQYSITLWDAVKFEVLQAQEPFLADEALVVIRNIAICLSKGEGLHAPDVTPGSDPLIQYLKPVNKECLEHLQEPASRQAKASGDILKAAASATIRSFDVVLKAAGPALFTLQQSSDGILNQRAVLSVVNQLFEASIATYGSWTDCGLNFDGGPTTLISEFKDKLLAIYSRALMSTVKEEVSYRLVAARGLLLLTQLRSVLDEHETGLIVQHFNEIVLDEESYGRDELKTKAMQALAEISVYKPGLITDITFPRFISRLPEDEAAAAVQSQDYRAVLAGLADISASKDLLETLMRRLLTKFDLLIQAGPRPDYPYTCAVLSTIKYVLDRSAKDSSLSLSIYYDRVVKGLSQKTAQAEQGPLRNTDVLNLLGRILNLIIRRSAADQQHEASDNVYNLYSTSNTSIKAILELRGESVTLSTWILAALSRSTMTGVLSHPPVDLINQLASYARSVASTSIVTACLDQISLLVNKHVPNSNLDQVDALVNVSAKNLEQDFKFDVRYLFALIHALTLRLSPTTTAHLTTLVNLLSSLDIDHARLVALGFTTILSPSDILSKQNDAVIRLLAPQRVFQTLVPIFSSRIRDQSASQERKEIYLIALSGILGTVSSDIVMPELPTLLPLLLQSLEINDANQTIKSATLETLLVVITKNPEALVESGYIPGTTRRLLATATLSKPQITTQDNINNQKVKNPNFTSTPKVRQLSLRCLHLLPKYVKNVPSPLLNLKKDVLHGLAACLDDPKRDVRKEAVDARAAWMRGVDSPDEDDDD